MAVKDIPSPKTSSPGGFIGEFYEIFKKHLIPILQKLFQGIRKRVKAVQLILWGQYNLNSKISDKIFKRYL